MPPFAISGARLANGLQTWYEPRPGTGTVALALVIPVGARHDPPHLHGLAHVVEHMLFNGTRQWSEDRLRDEVERRGGVINGATGKEMTWYFIHLPAAELAFGVKCLQQLVFKPSLPADLLAREKRIIVREAAPEIPIYLWRLYGWLLQCGFGVDVAECSRQVLFANSGLELPTIGFPETRRRITLDDVRAHYQRWYAPGGARLVAVGDFAPADLLKYAEHYLGALPPGSVEPTPARPPLPLRIGERWRLWVKPSDDDRLLAVALPFAGAADPDILAHALLARLMQDAVMEHLRQELGLIYSVGVEVAVYTDTGLIWLIVSVHHSELKVAEREIRAILDHLSPGKINPEQLERVRAATQGRLIMHTQSNAQQLEALIEQPGFLLGRAPQPLTDLLLAATRDDMQRAATRVLRKENRHWFVQDTSWLGMTILSALWLFVLVGLGRLAMLVVEGCLFWLKLLWPR